MLMSHDVHPSDSNWSVNQVIRKLVVDMERSFKNLYVFCGSPFDASLDVLLNFFKNNQKISVIEFERNPPSYYKGVKDTLNPKDVVSCDIELEADVTIVCDWAAATNEELLKRATVVVFFAMDSAEIFRASVANRLIFDYAKLIFHRYCEVFKQFESFHLKNSILVRSSAMKERIDVMGTCGAVVSRISSSLFLGDVGPDLRAAVWHNYRAPKAKDFERYSETQIFGVARALQKESKFYAKQLIAAVKKSEDGEATLAELAQISHHFPAIFHASFCSVLINEPAFLKKLLERLERALVEEDLDLVNALFQPFSLLSHHFVHRHVLFVDLSPKIVDVMRMAIQKSVEEGYALLWSMLKADFKRYVSLIARLDMEAKANTALPLLRNFRVHWEQEVKQCTWKEYWRVLGKLLQGSHHHCSVVTPKDVETLLALSDVNKSESLRVSAGALVALCSIFEYCDPEIAGLILPHHGVLCLRCIQLAQCYGKFDVSSRRLFAHFATLLMTYEGSTGKELEVEVSSKNKSKSKGIDKKEDGGKKAEFVEKFVDHVVNLNEEVIQEVTKRIEVADLLKKIDALEVKAKQLENVEALLDEATAKLERAEKERDIAIQKMKDLEGTLERLHKRDVKSVSRWSEELIKETGKEDDIKEDEIMKKEPKLVTVEEAEQLVRKIHSERRQLTTMRMSVNGSLKHLGSALYSSPTSFIFELIQNSNDCSFDDEVVPRLRVEVYDDTLVLQSNEKGFRAKDLWSICSICDSSKKAGESIGNKGLGFKAVFSCSDEVFVKSNNFCFQFREGFDEVDSYLTPHVVDRKNMPSLMNQVIENDEMTTTFFLPLRKRHLDSDFLDRTLASIEDTLLLSLKTLSCIEIVDKRRGSNSSREISRKMSEPNQMIPLLFSFTVEINGSQSFVCFEKKVVDIEEYLFDDDSLRDPITETNILICFPKNAAKQEGDDDDGRRYHLHAGLPVTSSVLLPFLVSADFELTSSREHLRDNSWNRFLLDQISDVFAFVATEDLRVQEEMARFTPKKGYGGGSLLYRRFVQNCRAKLGLNLTKRLGGGGQEEVVVQDGTYCPSLISVSYARKYAGICVVEDPSICDLGLFRKVELRDVLSVVTKLELYWDINNHFWINFFKKVIEKGDHLSQSQLLIDAPIWLERRGRRIAVRKKAFFLEKDGISFDWRPELCTVLSYESESEKKVLQHCFEELSVYHIVLMIIGVHMFRLTKEDHERVERDILFLSDHFVVYEEMVKKLGKIIYCSVATKIGEVVYATHALCPTLCGLVIDSSDNSVKLRDTAGWMERMTFEVGLVKLGCSYPADPTFTDPLLPSEVFCDLDAANVLLDLLKRVPKHLLLLLPRRLKVKSVQGDVVDVGITGSHRLFGDFGNIFTVPLAHLFPPELALLLQIKTDVTLSSIQSALLFLCEKKITDVTKYIALLLRVSLMISDDEDEKSGSKSMCLFMAEPSRRFVQSSDVFVKPSFLREACETLCCIDPSYGCVNERYNSKYLVCEDNLRLLGALSSPTIEMFCHALRCVMCYEDSYENIGVATDRMLTERAMNDAMTLYQAIETLLCDEQENKPLWNVEERETLSVSKVVDSDIPILCVDRRLRQIESFLRYTLNGDIASCIHAAKTQFHLVDVVLASSCPRLLKCLNIVSMELSCVVSWSHPSTSTERFYGSVSKVFRELLGEQYTCLGNRYCQVQLIFHDSWLLKVERGTLKAFKRDSWTEIDRSEARALAIVSTSPYFVFGNVVVVCNDFEKIRYDEEKTRLFFSSALLQLMKMRKGKSFDECSMIVQSALGKVSAEANGVAKEFFNQAPCLYNAKDFVTCNLGNDSGILEEIISFKSVSQQNQEEEELDEEDKEKFFDEFKASADQSLNVAAVPRNEIYMSRNNNSNTNTNKNNNNNNNNDQGRLEREVREIRNFQKEVDLNAGFRNNRIVDTSETDEVGLAGELFVHTLLLSLYGSSYNPLKNWKSSTRAKLLGQSRGCDDTLGYDFEIIDSLQMFCKKKTKMARVFIEVKGCAYAFNGTCYFSANERAVSQQILPSSDSLYLVFFVENCLNASQTRLYGYINLTENPECLKLQPSQYLGVLDTTKATKTKIVSTTTTKMTKQNKQHNQRKKR